MSGRWWVYSMEQFFKILVVCGVLVVGGCCGQSSKDLSKEENDLVIAFNRVIALTKQGTTLERYKDAMIEVDAVLARVDGLKRSQVRLDSFKMARNHLTNASRFWENSRRIIYEDKVSRSVFANYGSYQPVYPNAISIAGTNTDGSPNAYDMDTALVRDHAWKRAAKIITEINHL